MRLRTALLTALILVPGMVSRAAAMTYDLRWIHDRPDLPVMVFVIADGENLAEVPVEPPDADGVFTTRVVLPFGARIQVQVQDATGRTSGLSNAQIYGDDCHEWDLDGDGVVGLTDVASFRGEFSGGTASIAEFGLLRQFFGQACGSGS
jgi:hypothetical protein